MSTLWFALRYFASQDSSVDTSHLDTLPSADSPKLHCTFMSGFGYSSAPLLVGELLENEGRYAAALKWAQAECSCVVQDNRNAPLKARAGRLLGE